MASHLRGQGDASAVLSGRSAALGQQLLDPARWPLFKHSDWNQAVAAGRIKRVCLGPMGHTGRKSYLDGTVFVEDGRSYRTVTADAIGALVAQMPARRVSLR